MTATEVIERQRYAAKAFANEIDKKIYEWVEDELTPFVCISKASEPHKMRICPDFIICNNIYCNYFKPAHVRAERVLCYSIAHKVGAGEGKVIDLIEIDEC